MGFLIALKSHLHFLVLAPHDFHLVCSLIELPKVFVPISVPEDKKKGKPRIQISVPYALHLHMLFNPFFVVSQSINFGLRLLLLGLKPNHILGCVFQQSPLCSRKSLDQVLSWTTRLTLTVIRTLASFSAVRRVAASDIQDFFSSRNSRNFFCSSVFQSEYLSLADDARALCSRSSASRLTTCALYLRSLLYCMAHHYLRMTQRDI